MTLIEEREIYDGGYENLLDYYSIWLNVCDSPELEAAVVPRTEISAIGGDDGIIAAEAELVDLLGGQVDDPGVIIEFREICVRRSCTKIVQEKVAIARPIGVPTILSILASLHSIARIVSAVKAFRNKIIKGASSVWVIKSRSPASVEPTAN